MATKIIRRVFFNKKTGQASVTLPKKFIQKWVGKVPKEVLIELSKKGKTKIKW